MRRILLLALLTTLAATGLLPATAGAARADREDRLSGRFIVVYRGSVESVNRETDERERKRGFKSDLRYGRALKGFSARLNARQVKALEADPEVAYVSPDRPVRATAATPLAAGEPLPPTGVRRMEAATATTVREASSANVAVIDTGVDLAHPDLNAVDGKNCVGSGPAQDDNGHGTHVAGSIAARNNGSGVTGVAPGTKVYATKVLNGQGSGTQSQVICGIDWVTANAAALNIKVANMSLGGPGARLAPCATTTDPEHKAICNSVAAGVTYVVAAGNDGWDFDYAAQPDTPAVYPEALTVSAVTDSDGQGGGGGGAPACRTTEVDDRYAGFSNYAATGAGQSHTIAGPGTCIKSTWPGGGYDTISGTSMASPHVAGAVALCLGEAGAAGPCSGLSPAQIVQKMRSDASDHTAAANGFGFTGDPLRPVSGRYYGYMSWAGTAGDSPPPPPPAPSTRVSASPSSVTIETGSLRSGSVAALTGADSAYLEVNSTTRSTRTSAWYGTFGSVPSSLSNLKVTYQGRNSRTCTQVLAAYRYTTASWVTLDSRSVGTTEVAIADRAPTGAAADYRSSGGNVHVRVRCTTNSGSFYARGNQLKIAYDE